MADSLNRGEKLYSTEHGHRTENVDVGPEGHQEHVHGTMDISEQERTFQGFIKFWIYLFAAAVLTLIFLAIFNA